MRSILEQNFKLYGYEDEDASYFLDLYEKITSDKEACAIWNEALKLYCDDVSCDLSKVIDAADRIALILNLREYTTEWLIFFCLIPKAKEYYGERGISEEIFHETMKNLRYNLEEGKLVKGVRGFFDANWFKGFFNLERFGLGRLQFEIVPFGHYAKEPYGDLTLETKVINVHIPRSGLPLSPESVDESFAMAREFYKDQLGDKPRFICISWLLDPQSSAYLPEKSNIYKFMKRFTVIMSGTYKENTNLWRLFDTDEKNPDRLPTDTSVRRAVVAHLKAGGKMGWGFGVI